MKILVIKMMAQKRFKGTTMVVTLGWYGYWAMVLYLTGYSISLYGPFYGNRYTSSGILDKL